MHILLDLDGTLTDPGPGIARCLQHALAGLGRPVPQEDTLRRFVGPPLRETLATLLACDEAALIEEAVRLYRERYVRHGLRENSVYPGIPPALAALRSAGHRLWIATSKPHVYARRIAEDFGLAPLLDGVHGSELDGLNCDKGDLIAHVLRAEGIPAPEAWMVGDRVHDVVGAHRNGVAAVGVLWGYGTEQELRDAAPERTIRSPQELPAAVHP